MTVRPEGVGGSLDPLDHVIYVSNLRTQLQAKKRSKGVRVSGRPLRNAVEAEAKLVMRIRLLKTSRMQSVSSA